MIFPLKRIWTSFPIRHQICVFFLFYIFIVLVFITWDEINTCLGYPLK